MTITAVWAKTHQHTQGDVPHAPTMAVRVLLLHALDINRQWIRPRFPLIKSLYTKIKIKGYRCS